MTIVHMHHLRSLGLCSRGGAAWFAQHGLDWLDFVQHGIDASILEATGDHYALAVVSHARQLEAQA